VRAEPAQRLGQPRQWRVGILASSHDHSGCQTHQDQRRDADDFGRPAPDVRAGAARLDLSLVELAELIDQLGRALDEGTHGDEQLLQREPRRL
jgi:hypothetical protein